MPGKLKKGWKIWRFDQMATMVNERVDNPEDAGVEYYVGLEHLDPESLTIRRWGSPSDVAATKLLFRKGDIIFGRRRVYQRKLAVAHFDGICSAHAMVLRAKPDVVLSEFLPFFMQSDLFMERAKQISVGSLSPTINWKTLAQEEFALPPLDEQRRIAEVLVNYVGVQEYYQQMQFNLDIMNSSLIASSLFKETLNTLSASEEKFDLRNAWDWMPLKKLVIETKGGLFKPKDEYGMGVNIVGVSDLYRHTSIDGQNFNCIPASTQESDDYSLTEGDLIYGESSLVRDGIARTLPVTSRGSGTLFAWHTRRVRVRRSRVCPFFLSIYLNSLFGRRSILKRATTTVLTGMTVSDFLSIPVPIGPIEEQKTIYLQWSRITSGIHLIDLRKDKLGLHLTKIKNQIFEA